MPEYLTLNSVCSKAIRTELYSHPREDRILVMWTVLSLDEVRVGKNFLGRISFSVEINKEEKSFMYLQDALDTYNRGLL